MDDAIGFDDWLAICNLKAAYCRLLDTKDWQGWSTLFTPDCRFDTTPAGGLVIEGRDAMVDFVSTTLATARTAHHIHSPQMTVEGPGRVRVVWAMQDRVVKDEWSLTGYGHYHELCVKDESGWRIAEQVLTRLLVERTVGTPAT